MKSSWHAVPEDLIFPCQAEHFGMWRGQKKSSRRITACVGYSAPTLQFGVPQVDLRALPSAPHAKILLASNICDVCEVCSGAFPPACCACRLICIRPYLGSIRPIYQQRLAFRSTLIPFPIPFKVCHTIDSIRHTGSDGCAPTPSQYFALVVSSLMSLTGLPAPYCGGLGIGS